MGAKSKIEWTDATWTPIRARRIATGKVGWHCVHKSAGCAGCYAETINIRLGTGLPFKPGRAKDIEIFLDEKMLTAPLRWRKPRKVFVCSMTDLFADFVRDEWIDRMFAVMALCPQHTFIVLTKRPERMRAYLAIASLKQWANACVPGTLAITQSDVDRRLGLCQKFTFDQPTPVLPLPNVWLGTSCEDQPTWDERVQHLGAIPAAVRFVSAEPLLGHIDAGNAFDDESDTYRPIDWVIVGGESGQNARPMHPDWARSLRDQCAAAGVPFFFKQWGEHVPAELVSGDARDEPWRRTPDGRADHWSFDELTQPRDSLPTVKFERIGKKRAGRELDGREWNDFPRVRL